MRGSTAMPMGQGAHHLEGSLAPALLDPLSGPGIGASSLPAPPLVTTRAGPGELAHGSTPIGAAAQSCITRSTGAGARHMGHGSARTDEHRRLSQCRDLDMHGAMPGGLAPGGKVAAATHHPPQRIFRLDLRPARGPAGFQRQDGIGRRLLGKGRRVRRVIPAWRGQRTATNQTGRRPSWTAWGALSPTPPSMSTGK